MRSITTGTEQNRELIERDVEAFLQAGGKIIEIPRGMGKDAARNMQWKAMSIESLKRTKLNS